MIVFIMIIEQERRGIGNLIFPSKLKHNREVCQDKGCGRNRLQLPSARWDQNQRGLIHPSPLLRYHRVSCAEVG